MTATEKKQRSNHTGKRNDPIIQKELSYANLSQSEAQGKLNLRDTSILDLDECQLPIDIAYRFHQFKHYPAVELSLDYVLNLLCERCLNHYKKEKSITSRGIFTSDSSREMYENNNHFGYETFLTTQPLYLIDIIREEINLSLPLSPRCETCTKTKKLSQPLDDADETTPESPSRTYRPFADLRKLKKITDIQQTKT